MDEYSEKLAEQVKQQTLEKAEELADTGDYAAAMAVIDTARKESPEDEEFNSAYDEYAASHKSNLVTEALAAAETLSDNGDYLGALQTVNQTLTTVGEDDTLSAAAATYEDAYAKSVSAQVDTYLAEQNITAAKELLKTAEKEVPNNKVIDERITEVDEYKTVSLSTLTPINGAVVWNDGSPADPFGNNYSDAVNYAIIHRDHWNSIEHAAEYKLDKKYTELSFKLSPYSDFGEEATSYIQIYVNDYLRFTSEMITRKSGLIENIIDISDADTIKIVIRESGYGCIMLSDVVLKNTPNYTSEIDNTFTSLSLLKPINGGIVWNNDYPADPFNNAYNTAVNYAILHRDHWNSIEQSVEYYISGKYNKLSFDIAPYNDCGADAKITIKVYIDDVLKYTSSTVTRTTAPFSTGEIDVSNSNYIKIVAEQSGYGCIMITNAKLT